MPNRWRHVLPRVLIVVLVCVGAIGAGAGASQAMSLMTQDTNAFFGTNGALQHNGYAQSRYLGALFVRGLVARDATTADPGSAASWARIDAFVDATRANALVPYLTLTYRPVSWGDPGTALAIPSVAEFSFYCRYAASRYRGRVSNYSIWNEPNALPIKNPAGGSPIAVPAATYGQLYRACYNEIKGQDPSAHVYFGELATGANSCDYVTNAMNPSVPTI